MPAGYTPPVNLSSPPPIGNTTPNTVAATTIVAAGGLFSVDGSGNVTVGTNANIVNGAGTIGVFGNAGVEISQSGQPGGLIVSGTAAYAQGTLSLGKSGSLFGGLFISVPTSDPHVVGSVWSNLGILTLSAG